MISLLIILIVLGGLLYVVQLLPLDATVKQVIYVVAVLAMVIYILQYFLGGGGDVRLPR